MNNISLHFTYITYYNYSYNVLFSFGVVLWEMLTGVKPYVGLSLFMIGYGVGHSTLSLPIPTSCPTALSDLLTGL